MHGNSRSFKQQRGFTVVQMVITIAIIAIVSTIGILGIRTARAQFKMQNAARVFASYVEKARADSVRRHATSGNQASVEMFGEGTTSYAVTMDFGNGVETRSFELDSGITFGTAALKVTFDWRGRLTEQCPVTKACVFQIKNDSIKDQVPVDVSGSGDITVGAQHFPDQLIPEIALSVVPDDVDHGTPTPTATPTPDPAATPPIDTGGGGVDPVDGGGGTDPVATPTPTPTPTPNGNGNGGTGGNSGNGGNNGNNSTPTPTPTPTPSPNSSPSPAIPQCLSTISPSSLSLSQSTSGQQSGSATFTMTNATGVRTISANQLGNGNSLNIAVSLLRIDGSGSSVITVTTKNGAGNRGQFTVEVAGSPACGTSAKLTVFVSN